MSESSRLRRSIIDSSDDDVEEPLLSASLSAEAPQNIGSSKSGPKSKAKKSVVGDPSSDSIDEFSSSASSAPQAPNDQNGDFAFNSFLFFIMVLSILSLNCNGITDQSKRNGLLQWLRSLPVVVDVCL